MGISEIMEIKIKSGHRTEHVAFKVELRAPGTWKVTAEMLERPLEKLLVTLCENLFF